LREEGEGKGGEKKKKRQGKCLSPHKTKDHQKDFDSGKKGRRKGEREGGMVPRSTNLGGVLLQGGKGRGGGEKGSPWGVLEELS